jgi:hypothetical protein
MKRLIFLFFVLPSLLLLSSCGGNSPSSQGKSAGDYFAKRWNSDNSSGNWPSSDAVAKYCTDMEAQLETSNNWSLQQGTEYVDACAKATVDGFKK